METEKAALDQPIHKEEPPALSPEEQNLLDTFKATEEDAAKFPRELVLETADEAAKSPPESALKIPKESSAERYENLTQLISKMSLPEKIHLAMLGNQDARSLLVHEPNKVISLAVLRNPRITETEIAAYAQMKTLAEDVLLAIAKHKTWIKNYFVKLALVSNPKTPLSLSIKLLDHLHDRDLQNLSRSKNVSSVLARSAARLLFKRGG